MRHSQDKSLFESVGSFEVSFETKKKIMTLWLRYTRASFRVSHCFGERCISSADKHLARTAAVMKKRGVDSAAAARYKAEKYQTTKRESEKSSSGLSSGLTGRSSVIGGGAARADELFTSTGAAFGAGISGAAIAENRIKAAMEAGVFDAASASAETLAKVARSIGADGSPPPSSGNATERVLANANAAPRSFMLSRDVKEHQLQLNQDVAAAKAAGESHATITSSSSSLRGAKLQALFAKLDASLARYNDAVLSDSLSFSGTTFPMAQLARLGDFKVWARKQFPA